MAPPLKKPEGLESGRRNPHPAVPETHWKRYHIPDIHGSTSEADSFCRNSNGETTSDSVHLGSVHFDYKYDKDSVILCHYTLMIKGETREFDLVSKILDVKEITTGKGGYEHRVQYLNAHSQDREEIIQYIFDEERKNRKRERGF